MRRRHPGSQRQNSFIIVIVKCETPGAILSEDGFAGGSIEHQKTRKYTEKKTKSDLFGVSRCASVLNRNSAESETICIR
jgi:hypothetical protein